MNFKTGIINDVIIKPLSRYTDARGWLCELFRNDEVPEAYQPVMAYWSLTHPGVVRGPHEHVQQSDYFCFLGPSDFKLYLWDARENSPTYKVRQTEVVGASRAVMVIIPPGVVHAYKNVGCVDGLVFNAANRLYKGPGRKEEVDEIRHEADVNTPFQVD